MIALHNLSVAYGDKPVLQTISATFESGGFVCLVGRNGSGKSTLLRALCGMQRYTGDILLDGRELRSFSQRELARRIAYLPQTRPLPAIDVRTLISHGRFPHLGFSKLLGRQDERLVEQAAEWTGVGGLLSRSLQELSGGERQRVYLAMVVAQDADVILLDEPATYLDICHQIELLELLEQLHRQGKQIIMVAHDLAQAFSCATHAVLLEEGEIAAQGGPAQVCTDPRVAEIFGVRLCAETNPDGLYRYRLARKQTGQEDPPAHELQDGGLR